MINSRKIEDLDIATAAKCRSFMDKCKVAGLNVLITSTYRDAESQNALYAQGRTTPGKIVTKAKGGDSFHQYKVAFDFVPLINGKAVWNDDSLWARAGFIAESCGLVWGGRWSGFTDKPHCQNTGTKTLADFKAGKVK